MAVSANSVTLVEIRKGVAAFGRKEPRDAMYRVATRLVNQTWGQPSEVADAIGILLLTWNQAFYRYGAIDFDRVELALTTHASDLAHFRQSELLNLTPSDLARVPTLYNAILASCSIVTSRSRQTRRSPTSAGKALHMLAPNTFPLWDDKIARGVGCHGHWLSNSAQDYLGLMKWCDGVLRQITARSNVAHTQASLDASARFSKPLLKYLDEYLYAKFTKKWI
jgi:hypothetical protein